MSNVILSTVFTIYWGYSVLTIACLYIPQGGLLAVPAMLTLATTNSLYDQLPDTDTMRRLIQPLADRQGAASPL